MLLVGASLVVAVIGVASFWLADHYHIGPVWVFAAPVAAIFIAVVGWGYRRLFRSPEFLLFLSAWMSVHVAVALLVTFFLGFVYYIPAVMLELWIGYILAILWFGPPPDKGIR